MGLTDGVMGLKTPIVVTVETVDGVKYSMTLEQASIGHNCETRRFVIDGTLREPELVILS